MATDVTSVQDGQVYGGHIYTYNGSTWSDLGPFGDNLSSVSCSSPRFCVVLGYLGDGSVYSLTWNGTTMSWPPTLVDSGASVSLAPTIGYPDSAGRSRRGMCGCPAVCLAGFAGSPRPLGVDEQAG